MATRCLIIGVVCVVAAAVMAPSQSAAQSARDLDALSRRVVTREKPQKPELTIALGHTFPYTAVAFTPDGRFVLSGSGDRTLKLWDIESGKEVRSFQRHGDWVNDLAVSADGSLAISAGGSDNSAKVWDLTTGRELWTLTAGTGRVKTVDIDAERRVALSTTEEGVLRVWNLDTGAEVLVLQGASHGRFNPDGMHIVGCGDRLCQVWDRRSGGSVRKFKASDGGINTVAVSGDGRHLLTGDWSGVVSLWRLADGTLLGNYEAEKDDEYITSVSFRPDGQEMLASSSEGWVRVWSTEPPFARERIFREHTESVWSAEFHPDGKLIASGSGAILGSSSDNSVRLWETEAMREVQRLEGHVSTVHDAVFDADGRYILSGHQDHTFKLWDLERGGAPRVWPDLGDEVESVSFSPDQRAALVATGRSSTQLWNLDGTGPLIAPGNAPARFTPDGRFVISVASYGDSSGDYKATIQRWEPGSGVEPQAFEGRHEDTVTSIAVTHDGRYALTGSRDGTAQLWSIESLRSIARFEGHADRVYAVAFSPDSTKAVTASGDLTLRLWDVATHKTLRTFEGHELWITSVAFSPDGRFILSGSADKTVRLWNAETGAAVATLTGHQSYVNSVGFAPSGEYALSGSSDGTVKIWRLDTRSDLVTLVAARGASASFAAVTPDGLFDGTTDDLDELLHFVFENDVIELAQLKERYYEPGLVAKLLGFNTSEPLRKVATFADPAIYPEISSLDVSDDELRVSLRNRGGGIGAVQVSINGKEITADARVPGADPNSAEMKIVVPLAAQPFIRRGGTNRIEVRAYNAEGYLSSRPRGALLISDSHGAADPPELWAVVVGVTDYRGEAIDLRYAAKDARDMAQALQLAATRLFGPERVHLSVLTTDSGNLYPTKENILAAFRNAEGATSEDILVVYLAGHGVSGAGQDGLYYYLTADARSAELTDPAVRSTSAISSRELTELIRGIPALKQVLIIDTCAAGRAVEKLTEKREIPSSQIRAFERMRDRMGLHVLAGSAADAVSYEASRYGQGLLTYSLLLGMRGAALRADEFVDVSRLLQFSADRVPGFASDVGGIQRPLVATPSGGSSFDIGRLNKSDKAKIPLGEVRPLVLRSNFQDERLFRDLLGLGKLVDAALNDASARGRAAPLIFVDTAEFPGAYALVGRYVTEAARLRVSVRVFREDEMIGAFTVAGDVADLSLVTRQIIEETERVLRG